MCASLCRLHIQRTVWHQSIPATYDWDSIEINSRILCFNYCLFRVWLEGHSHIWYNLTLKLNVCVCVSWKSSNTKTGWASSRRQKKVEFSVWLWDTTERFTLYFSTSSTADHNTLANRRGGVSTGRILVCREERLQVFKAETVQSCLPDVVCTEGRTGGRSWTTPASNARLGDHLTWRWSLLGLELEADDESRHWKKGDANVHQTGRRPSGVARPVSVARAETPAALAPTFLHGKTPKHIYVRQRSREEPTRLTARGTTRRRLCWNQWFSFTCDLSFCPALHRSQKDALNRPIVGREAGKRPKHGQKESSSRIKHSGTWKGADFLLVRLVSIQMLYINGAFRFSLHSY